DCGAGAEVRTRGCRSSAWGRWCDARAARGRAGRASSAPPPDRTATARAQRLGCNRGPDRGDDVTSRRTARGSSGARARQPRGQVGAAPKRLEVTLDGLRQLRERIRQLQLEPGDWPIMDALVSNQIIRTEERNERKIAKLAAAAEDTGGPEASSHAGGSTESSFSSSTSTTSGSASPGANTASGDEAASPTHGAGETTR